MTTPTPTKLRALRSSARHYFTDCEGRQLLCIIGTAEQLKALEDAADALELVAKPAVIYRDMTDEEVSSMVRAMRDAPQMPLVQETAKAMIMVDAANTESAIREKLIEMGWVPPGGGLTHDQLRAAVALEINDWYAEARWRTAETAERAMMLLCRRLGVEPGDGAVPSGQPTPPTARDTKLKP